MVQVIYTLQVPRRIHNCTTASNYYGIAKWRRKRFLSMTSSRGLVVDQSGRLLAPLPFNLLHVGQEWMSPEFEVLALTVNIAYFLVKSIRHLNTPEPASFFLVVNLFNTPTLYCICKQACHVTTHYFRIYYVRYSVYFKIALHIFNQWVIQRKLFFHNRYISILRHPRDVSHLRGS